MYRISIYDVHYDIKGCGLLITGHGHKKLALLK